MLLQPKEFTTNAQDGSARAYVLSKFPAVAGREIIAKYPLSAMPKLGDYAVNEETMLKLMSFVAVRLGDGSEIPLKSRALVDNHVPDWETLARIEVAMMEYNCSFFGTGRASTFFEAIARKAQAFLTSTLTDLLVQSSPKGGRRSTS